MKIFEVDISSYSKTTKIMDEIFNPKNEYTRVVFKDAICGTLQYKFELVADLETKECEYNCDVPHYYYTMTQLKRGLQIPHFNNVENICDIADYGIEDEIEIYLQNEKIEIGTIIPFKGDYEIHGQRTQDYKSGGWGNYPAPKLYMVGFIVYKHF